MRQYGRAVRLEDLLPEEANGAIRHALRLAASALNYLEGSPHESSVHTDLHRFGAWAHKHFPKDCRFEWNGDSYEHRCPVAIAHKRFGFSPGFTSRPLCSLCGSDSASCEHIPGQIYQVHGGSVRGRCRVCGADECSAHSSDGFYEAVACNILTDLEFREVSFVSVPAQPDARLTAIPVSTDALWERFGSRFKPGVTTISCHECAAPCQGFDYLHSDA